MTRGIRAFVDRDWRSVRESKDDYWAARIARLGPADGLRIAGELRAQVIAMHPDWPSPEDRDADLAHHVRLAELFRRVDAPRRDPCVRSREQILRHQLISTPRSDI